MCASETLWQFNDASYIHTYIHTYINIHTYIIAWEIWPVLLELSLLALAHSACLMHKWPAEHDLLVSMTSCNIDFSFECVCACVHYLTTNEFKVQTQD